jgi:hypothetical protein
LFHDNLISRYGKELLRLIVTVLKVPIPITETEEFGSGLKSEPGHHITMVKLDVNSPEESINFFLDYSLPILEPLIQLVTPKHNDFVVMVGADESDVLLQEMVELLEDVCSFQIC